MKTANASIYLDRNRPKLSGRCSVKIRITFNRKRKYYSTGIDLTTDEFDKTLFGKRRTLEQKELKIKIEYFENKAQDIINHLSIFSFDAFEESFLDERNVHNSVSFAFDKYIDELKFDKRLGTASSYECAKNSIEDFKKELTFSEITPNLLKKYERWMLDNGKSITTVGIYLRCLRAIWNQQNIDSKVYPFGNGKYSIPSSKNTKKALTAEEVSLIFNYKAPTGSMTERAKDYWIFLFLSNGMNVKDFCSIKWENINKNMLTYLRAKTQRSRRERKFISFALKDESLDVIKKWGVQSLNPTSYVFPHFNENMTEEQKRGTYQQLTKIINKYIKLIAKEVGIEKDVTTYYARHSFATILKRSGANIEMISELLGHSSVNVTQGYLDSFEDEQIHKTTDVLIDALKKTN